MPSNRLDRFIQEMPGTEKKSNYKRKLSKENQKVNWIPKQEFNWCLFQWWQRHNFHKIGVWDSQGRRPIVLELEWIHQTHGRSLDALFKECWPSDILRKWHCDNCKEYKLVKTHTWMQQQVTCSCPDWERTIHGSWWNHQRCLLDGCYQTMILVAASPPLQFLSCFWMASHRKDWYWRRDWIGSVGDAYDQKVLPWKSNPPTKALPSLWAPWGKRIQASGTPSHTWALIIWFTIK